MENFQIQSFIRFKSFRNFFMLFGNEYQNYKK